MGDEFTLGTEWQTGDSREEVEDEEVGVESEQEQEKTKLPPKMRKRRIHQELGTLGGTYKSTSTNGSGPDRTGSRGMNGMDNG